MDFMSLFQALRFVAMVLQIILHAIRISQFWTKLKAKRALKAQASPQLAFSFA